MESPILSIVTVTYNDLDGVLRTLESLKPLLELPESQVQIHVVDGGTAGDFSSKLQPYTGRLDLISEPDGGIYDAMNKGLARAEGRFVWFLNGGDESRVSDWSSLRRILERAGAALIFCSYELTISGRTIIRRARDARYIRHGLPTSHQAIFYPTALARAAQYDCSYKVVGDYHLTARLLLGGAQSIRSGLVVASFNDAGWSSAQANLLVKEASRVQYEVLSIGSVGVLVSRAHHIASRMVHRMLRYRQQFQIKIHVLTEGEPRNED